VLTWVGSSSPALLQGAFEIRGLATERAGQWTTSSEHIFLAWLSATLMLSECLEISVVQQGSGVDRDT